MLKKFILWEFPRGSWQYDVVVGLILAFIFLTPRSLFYDQPRIPKASSISMLPSDRGSDEFFVDTQLLVKIPENQRIEKLSQMLRSRTGNSRLTVTRVEPILDSEGNLQGYLAFARP